MPHPCLIKRFPYCTVIPSVVEESGYQIGAVGENIQLAFYKDRVAFGPISAFKVTHRAQVPLGAFIEVQDDMA